MTEYWVEHDSRFMAGDAFFFPLDYWLKIHTTFASVGITVIEFLDMYISMLIDWRTASGYSFGFS